MLKEYSGFTLMEIIVAMIVVGILSAGGLMVYNGLIESSNVTATVQSVGKLEHAVSSFIQVNGGTITPPTGLTLAQAMQEDNLVPPSWNVNGAEIIPPNASFVQYYYISSDAPAGGYYYVLGISAPQMTNSQALNICDSIENSISGVSSDGSTSFNIGNGQTCLTDLFNGNASSANNTAFSGMLTFTFD